MRIPFVDGFAKGETFPGEDCGMTICMARPRELSVEDMTEGFDPYADPFDEVIYYVHRFAFFNRAIRVASIHPVGAAILHEDLFDVLASDKAKAAVE